MTSGYEWRGYLDPSHSLMFLMGFPMRYPRFFIVWFVALGLAASPTVIARADHTDARTGERAYAGSVFEIVDQAVLGGDPLSWHGAVDALAEATELDSDEASQLLDAVAELVLAVADAGQRTGVLAIPEVNRLIADVLGPPPTAEAPEGTADLREPWSEPEVDTPGGERAAAASVGEPVEQLPVDPVERWRPLVEQYFEQARVSEALSIITCESNGDPTITNPRSGAAGLFQFVSGTWEHASEQAGYGGESAFDPEANIAAAAWLVDYSQAAGQTAWAHWTCRP